MGTPQSAVSWARLRRGRADLIVSDQSTHKTARYFFISQSVSWTRYSSHSFRFSST